MSWIRLSGNRLTRTVRGREEELGRIEPESGSDLCVLWLKDTFGVVSAAGMNIRADEFPSMDSARRNVLASPTVYIWHQVWVRCVLKREAERELEVLWDRLGVGGTAPSRQVAKDWLRGHLDRLPIDDVMRLFGQIATARFSKAVEELIERHLRDE